MSDKDIILTTFTATLKSDKFAELLDKIDELVVRELAKSWEASGHKMTGKLIEDMYAQYELNKGGFVINYMADAYGAYLNSGVSPARVPYRRGSGAGSSMYIDGLIRYVRQRMAISDLKEAKSIAFAIANVQKKKGITIATGGKGSKWADKAAEELNLESVFSDLSETYVVESLSQVFEKFNSNGNNSNNGTSVI